MLKLVVCVAAILMTIACGARGPVRSPKPSAPVRGAVNVPPSDSLQTFMDKVRARSGLAVPRSLPIQNVEASDPRLAAALVAVVTRPTSANHRAVAAEYARLGILDKAHEYLNAAVAIDPHDAAAWDGMARLWRDGGFPQVGLEDAYRALRFAPASPVVHNTLGTLFQALGRRVEARTEYEKALALDSTASYAWSNLCYGWMLDGQAPKALAACRRALELQPGLEAALNNLALAHAVNGDFRSAEYIFALAGRRGRAQYNLGIVEMARRRYPEAVKAFEAAQALRPEFRAAGLMARVAREHVSTRSEP